MERAHRPADRTSRGATPPHTLRSTRFPIGSKGGAASNSGTRFLRTFDIFHAWPRAGFAHSGVEIRRCHPSPDYTRRTVEPGPRTVCQLRREDVRFGKVLPGTPERQVP